MSLAVRPLPRSQLGRALRAARVIHPFPVGLNVIATVALAVIASDGVPSNSVLARLAAGMFCAQAAIGASNDYFDRDLDARTKRWKPIVRGLVEPQTALLLAGAGSVAAGAVALTFGLPAAAVGALGLASGLAYNARLKRTVLSALPFMVALPVLPIWVWLSLDRFMSELWWLIPFAPLAALAVHLSNALVDFDGDAGAGVRGLAQALGFRRALSLAWGGFGAALALAFLLGLVLEYAWAPFLAGILPATLLLASSVSAYLFRPGPATLQLGFGLTGVATACLAAGWLAAVS